MIKEGKDYYIWLKHHRNEKRCLANADLFLCDACQKPATVNSVWIINGATDQMINQANKLFEKYGEFTELGADSEGNCFCEDCYYDNAILEE